MVQEMKNSEDGSVSRTELTRVKEDHLQNEKKFVQPLLRNVPDMIWVQTLTLDLVQTYQWHMVHCIIK